MLPDTAPLPIAARFTTGTPDVVTVVFDVRLTPDLIDDAQWSGRFNDRALDAVSAEAAGDHVNVSVIDNGPDLGIDQISYNDSVGDLRSFYQGIPAVSFTDFPIT